MVYENQGKTQVSLNNLQAMTSKQKQQIAELIEHKNSISQAAHELQEKVENNSLKISKVIRKASEAHRISSRGPSANRQQEENGINEIGDSLTS